MPAGPGADPTPPGFLRAIPGDMGSQLLGVGVGRMAVQVGYELFGSGYG